VGHVDSYVDSYVDSVRNEGELDYDNLAEYLDNLPTRRGMGNRSSEEELRGQLLLPRDDLVRGAHQEKCNGSGQCEHHTIAERGDLIYKCRLRMMEESEVGSKGRMAYVRLLIDSCKSLVGVVIGDDRGTTTPAVVCSLDATPVCPNLFRYVHGIKPATWYRQVRSWGEEGGSGISARKALGTSAPTTTVGAEWLAWLRVFADSYGQVSPVNTGEDVDDCQFLPLRHKSQVHNTYVSDMRHRGQPYIGYERSTVLWAKYCPKIKRARRKGSFCQCVRCANYATELHKAKTYHAAERTKRNWQAHIVLMTRARQKYYKHREKARRFPERYLSLILDGMEKRKTVYPRWPNAPTSLELLRKLPQHTYGVLAHGHQPSLFIVDGQKGKGGANLTVTVLDRWIANFLDEGKVLPPVLYLQLDNTGSDNKNYGVMAYLQNLVACGVFFKIKVSFLPVGHTHEDIDQYFSRIGQALTVSGIRSRPHFVQVVTDSFKDPASRPSFTFISVIAQWSEMYTDEKLKVPPPVRIGLAVLFVHWTNLNCSWPTAAEGQRDFGSPCVSVCEVQACQAFGHH
jgi:hypothetical protein